MEESGDKVNDAQEVKEGKKEQKNGKKCSAWRQVVASVYNVIFCSNAQEIIIYILLQPPFFHLLRACYTHPHHSVIVWHVCW